MHYGLRHKKETALSDGLPTSPLCDKAERTMKAIVSTMMRRMILRRFRFGFFCFSAFGALSAA